MRPLLFLFAAALLPAQPNTHSPAEKHAGRQRPFHGPSLAGWRWSSPNPRPHPPRPPARAPPAAPPPPPPTPRPPPPPPPPT
ncbi:MAG: hypothetical protein ACK527_09470, partial [Acidobacteriota bacterium]